MKTPTLGLLLGLLLCAITLVGQSPRRYTSADLLAGIQKLQFLGSALYVAAHPDDENTRMIAHLANVRHARTAYLSLTRGDGGQNLVGPEIRELLGLIRTQELLAARRTDGGIQFFTRANDYGYSKHPDEAFTLWEKDQVLADVVWIMRTFQPDIIINRFDHRSAGSTHGHHTASAMLSVEAYDLVSDPAAYPEQLRYTNTWEPTRQFFNTSWWFYGSQEAFAKADKSKLIELDLGSYLPWRGMSVGEIAAYSRSQHKSQGFGATPERGQTAEYLELLRGDLPPNGDPFAGINTTWTRVPGGAPIGEALVDIEAQFDLQHPERSLPALLGVLQQLRDLPNGGHWQSVKLAELEELIAGFTGLYLEATASTPTAAPGQTITLTLEAVNRAAGQLRLRATHLLTNPTVQRDSVLNLALPNNEKQEWQQALTLPSALDYSSPYWLREDATVGMYTVKDQLRRGLPETPAPVRVAFDLEYYQADSEQWVPMTLTRPLVYKETDRVRGEVYQPFEVVPPVFVRLGEAAYIFANRSPQQVQVTVTAGQKDVQGQVRLQTPNAGWQVSPAQHDFAIEQRGAEQTFVFTVQPPTDQQSGDLMATVSYAGNDYDQARTLIQYEHIPTQTVLSPARARVARLSLEKRGERIGYLAGAGDDIPAALRTMGYAVDMLQLTDVRASQLTNYDAVVVGVRAYNTLDRIAFVNAELLKYVEKGGTLVVQYNTNRGLNVPSEKMGPYPFRLSRDRVTVEEAEVRILAPTHPALTTPNQITAADFEDWVQERGLYFSDEWDERYTPLLSSHDPGEQPLDGGLLVAKYGQGYYVYTGYSWFRQLPAGVPGAYRLFANLVSLGN